MYQPKIKDRHIRRLYFLAKKQGKKMTHVLNEIVEEALVGEPEPPPYEWQRVRRQLSLDRDKRKLRAFHKLMRDFHGGDDVENIHRETYQGDGNGRGDYSPISQQD